MMQINSSRLLFLLPKINTAFENGRKSEKRKKKKEKQATFSDGTHKQPHFFSSFVTTDRPIIYVCNVHI